MQRVAACCSVLQRVAVEQCGTSADIRSVLSCTVLVLKCVAAWCSVVQRVAACCSVLQGISVSCGASQYDKVLLKDYRALFHQSAHGGEGGVEARLSACVIFVWPNHPILSFRTRKLSQCLSRYVSLNQSHTLLCISLTRTDNHSFKSTKRDETPGSQFLHTYLYIYIYTHT